MSLFSTAETRNKKKHARWATSLAKKVSRKASRLGCALETALVTPDADQELQAILYDAYQDSTDSGIVLSATIRECDFLAVLPYPCERLTMKFGIPVNIQWQSLYTHTGGDYSSKGRWICDPTDRKKSRFMNRRFPKPITGYVDGAKGAFVTIKSGGHVGPGPQGGTVLFISCLCPKGKEARIVSEALARMEDVVSFLREHAQ